jgi:prolyl-tRNA synthetase
MQYDLQGIPIQVVIGENEMTHSTVVLTRRDTKEQVVVGIDVFLSTTESLLKAIQDNLYQRALTFQKEKTTHVDTYSVFKQVVKEKRGLLMAHWDGTIATEQYIKKETGASIRCIPSIKTEEEGVCIYSGKPSKQRVVFAQAY